MKGVIRRDGRLIYDERIDDPTPASGQVLVRTLACGICGSDLHALDHLDHMVEMARRSGSSTTLTGSEDVIFGHEFCAEIVDFGPDCRQRLRRGSKVVSMPYAIGPNGMELVGFSNRFPGGFGEYMVLQEALLLEVPGDLSTEMAATTEPFAVGAHAVARARVDPETVALVVGCGPVGLAVLSALKARGCGPVIACDFSAARRDVAARLGADVVIDPANVSPHGEWAKFDVPATLTDKSARAMLGRKSRRAVIFECVGVPGLLQSLIENAPPASRIVVAGVCMEQDRIEPAIAINKELALDFVFAYSAEEFAGTLKDIAEKRIAADAILSGAIGLTEVATTFERLKTDPRMVKVMVTP